MLTKRLRVSLLAVAALFLAHCGEGRARERAAKAVGDVDLEPGDKLGAFEAVLKMEPRTYALSHVGGAAYAEFADHLVVLEFAGELSSVADSSQPIAVFVNLPFQGRLLGVRLADSVGQALRAVRAHYPNAKVAPPRPGRAPGEYTILLEGPFELIRQVISGEPDEEVSLQFYDSRYRVRVASP